MGGHVGNEGMVGRRENDEGKSIVTRTNPARTGRGKPGGGCREKGATMIWTWGRENRDCRMVGRRWTGNRGGVKPRGLLRGSSTGDVLVERKQAGTRVIGNFGEGVRKEFSGRGGIPQSGEARLMLWKEGGGGRILMDQLEAEERNSSVGRFRGMDRERKFRGLWGMEVAGDGRRNGIGGRSREQGLAGKPKTGRKGMVNRAFCTAR